MTSPDSKRMAGKQGKNLPEFQEFKEPYPYSRSQWTIRAVVVASFVTTVVLMRHPLLESFLSVASAWIIWFKLPRVVGYSIVLISVIVIFLLNRIPHEYVHYRTGILLGNEPEIHDLSPLSKRAPHVGIPEQWNTRGHNVIFLLGPFFVLNTLLLALAVMDIDPHLTLYSLSAFVANTSGAGGDLLGAYDDLRLPEQTRIYYPGPHSSGYIYEPKE